MAERPQRDQTKDEPAGQEEPAELPPGVRTVDQGRLLAKMKARAGEHFQEASMLETLLEDAEAERDRLREENAGLRAELVKATSARAGSGTSRSG